LTRAAHLPHLLSITALALLAACTTPQRVAQPAPADTPTLRVMTFNVNFGMAGDPETIEAIRAEDADLILLQETNERWERALRAELGQEYPYIHFHHAGAAGGLAVLSRTPVEVVETIPSPIGWFPAWRLHAETAIGPIQLLNLHLRPPISDDGSWIKGYLNTPPLRQKEIRHYMSELDPALPTLVAGDFNESAEGQVVGFLRAEGLESALEEFAPGADTWRWPLPVGSVSTQLDHVAYDQRRLTPIDAHVRRAGNSDHYPVVTTFIAKR
jgi:endonuclease/exonuclease/phosphatase (EEP) superfamily protein YafD